MTQIATEAGHWYLQDSTPYYTYIAKDGRELPVTLRQARPKQAVPSVSMIQKLAPSDPLENWKRNQVIQIAAENPRGETEGIQAYMDRIQGLFRDRGDAIMALGSRIHGEIEKALTDTVWMPSPEARAAIQALGEWCGLDGLYCERSFAHPLGYGGKCDVHKRKWLSLTALDEGWVCDFKTKDFDESWAPITWDNHAIQLAAYREGFGMPRARCAIIFVSTAVPGLTHTVELAESKLQHGWELFKCLLALWQTKNKYKPTWEPNINGAHQHVSA